MTAEMKENVAGEKLPLDELINLLGDADAQVRAQARHQLCARADEAIPRLLAVMQAVRETTRFEISRVLTEMGEAAVKPMMNAVGHPDVVVQTMAARVLSLIGGEDARKLLDQAATREERRTVRKEFREASAKIARRLESMGISTGARFVEEDQKLERRNGLSEREREEKRLYFNIVRNLIIANWARPHFFSAELDAEEILVTLKVDSDGSVSRVLIENRWQNSSLGESLKDAIRRAAPFPPVPEVVARGKGEIEITFILPVPS